MNTSIWIKVSGRKRYSSWSAGAVHAFKTKPTTHGQDIAIKIDLEIPDAYFETPEIKAVVSLPSPAGREVIAATVERGIAEALTREMGVTVRLVLEATQ